MRCLYCNKVIKNFLDGFCDKDCEHLFYNYSDFQLFMKGLRKNYTGFNKAVIQNAKESLWESWKEIKDEKRIQNF